jgi:hypothetical protein|tara:strand:+ start:288 stop:836 length:549 start_codon:yes stop_codon:yes gene_type:complete
MAPDADNLDPHLKPQIDFFLRDGLVMPELAYIGHVEELQDDWPAIVSAFFGAKPGAQVRQILEHDRLHVRSKGSDHYYDSESLGGLGANFALLNMSDSVREIIAEAFRVDEVCLGYQHSRADSRAVMTEQDMEEAMAQTTKENEAAQKAFADAAKVNADEKEAAIKAFADAAAANAAPGRSL